MVFKSIVLCHRIIAVLYLDKSDIIQFLRRFVGIVWMETKN